MKRKYTLEIFEKKGASKQPFIGEGYITPEQWEAKIKRIDALNLEFHKDYLNFKAGGERKFKAIV
jgi:hypothetical protein